jgi:hypothetical protein
MSKKKKKGKNEKSRIDWKTLIIAAILDFIVSLITLVIEKLLD